MSEPLPILLDYVASHSHAIFTRGELNLNIIGLRSSNPRAGKFDDRICVVYKDKNGWISRCWKATCDPGVYFLKHPMRVEGCAVLAPGQYRGAYRIGTHRNYTSLVQTGGPVRLFRDRNFDEIVDQEARTLTDPVYAGINIHRASPRKDGKSGGGSTEVQKWSAGCQVLADADDHAELMGLAQASSARYGNSFTYTLLPAPKF
mgnify:FL=1